MIHRCLKCQELYVYSFLWYDAAYSGLNLLWFLSLLCKCEKQFIPFMITQDKCVRERGEENKKKLPHTANHFIHGRLQPAEIYCYDSAVLKRNCSEHRNNQSMTCYLFSVAAPATPQPKIPPHPQLRATCFFDGRNSHPHPQLFKIDFF